MHCCIRCSLEITAGLQIQNDNERMNEYKCMSITEQYVTNKIKLKQCQQLDNIRNAYVHADDQLSGSIKYDALCVHYCD